MKLNKMALGIGLISMSVGMMGCGTNNDNISSRAPSPSNYPSQVRMDMTDNNNSMMTNGKYSTTTRGRVLQPRNTSNYAKYPNTTNRTRNGKRNATTNRTNTIDGTKYGLSNINTNSTTNPSYGTNNASNSDIAKMNNIQNEISRLTGYDNINCIVNGNTAIVGCTDPNNSATNEQIKKEIKSIVKACEPSITKCEVINNREGITKIGSMVDNMKKGNIGSTISKDFEDMLNDITR